MITIGFHGCGLVPVLILLKGIAKWKQDGDCGGDRFFGGNWGEIQSSKFKVQG
jgi:hypothetical protein